MAVIDRDTPVVGAADERTHREPETASGSADTDVWSMPARVLLATLSAGAGAIHLAMVPSHANQWLPEGIAFALAGWIQLGFALLIVVRPSRPAVRAMVAANVVFVGAWLTTRVVGSPFGPEAWSPHDASFVDLVCVACEAALIGVSVMLLTRPGLGAGMRPARVKWLAIVPIGILALASAAIASPGATNHAHGGSAESASAAGGHDHGPDGAAPEDDLGLSLIMNGAGEGGGHVHDNTTVELDPRTQELLDAQLAQLEPFIEKYPTVADAEAAGYTRQGPYSPALGAHYSERTGSVNLGTTMTDEALQHPMLIYDGVTPDSKLSGFMYNIFSTDTENPPEGFVGPNDAWHYHTNVCITFSPDGTTNAPLGADTSATQELCDQYGGTLIANTGYMAHVWPVPGYESDEGMFSNLNSKLTCPNGTYYTIPMEEIGNRTTVCADVDA
jgi:hypothetical protein